ncbi:unnamed protein product [Gongylonema pulchrum]|uniref:EF-hand domain-containing protein n=1 Tax=Gongylonema pulchrum TaxID=637853 RepID=A0A183EPD7_9BILA|nr:unnamed protein product [Gongylonema pulchrum]
MFDSDSDGYLSKEDVQNVYAHLNIEDSARNMRTDGFGRASLMDFVCWANENKRVDELLEVVVQKRFCACSGEKRICDILLTAIFPIYSFCTLLQELPICCGDEYKIESFSSGTFVWDCIQIQQKLNSQWLDFRLSGFKQRILLSCFAEWNVVSSEWWRQWVYAMMSDSKVPPINNSSIIAAKQKNDWSNKAGPFDFFQ